MRTRLIALAPALIALLAAGCGSASLGAASGSPAAASSPAAAPSGTAAPATGAGSTASAAPASALASGAGGTAADTAGSTACQPPKVAASDQLTGVQFVSAEQGWAVGQDAILATTDGGARWTRQLSGRLGLTGVDFISARDGWAVGAGTLLATTDGGAHWAPLPAPCPLLRSVHFISASDGFAIAGGGGEAASPAQPGTSGELLATRDGGRSWHRLAAPANAQSACFSDPGHGWLGASGLLYRTADGGAHWAALTKAAKTEGAGDPGVMTVECASDGTAWALLVGDAGMSQDAHVGYHANQTGATALFAEQYFQTPGAQPTANSPGSDAGPFSAVSAGTAVFIDWCSACGYGTAPWDLATNSGTTLTPKGNVGGIIAPEAASFTSAQDGWVAGYASQWNAKEKSRGQQRIVATSDGGRTWHVQFAGPWSAWT
jgi:photosystem II stability/assembly factor-like uncharacterized protein